MALFNGTKHAETINGSAGDDFIFGNNGNDILFGNDGNDIIDGGNGSDTLRGGAGDDMLDGGNGQDTSVYAGKRADYHVTRRSDGTVVVRDLRPGAADGTDRLVSIERIQFADGTFKTVDLISTNAAPLAVDDALTLAENAGATNVTAILLANDSDADGDAFKVTSVEAVSDKGAAVTVAADGTVSYNAGSIFAALNTGETAIDKFTYTITDAAGLTSTATATVTITGLSQNNAPVAVNDMLTLAENAGPRDLTALILGNDTDADGDALKVISVQRLTNSFASVTVGADGKVVYDSGAIFSYLKDGETFTEKFSYTVVDAAGATSTATASVKITGITQNPDFYFYVPEDGVKGGMMSILQPYFNMNIESIDTEGTTGTVKFDDVAGILSFTADHDSFDTLLPDSKMETYFTVVGANGERKLISMVVEGINDQIVAVDDAVSIGEGETSGNLRLALTGNDIDPDSSVNIRRIVALDTSGTQGVATLDTGKQTVTYSAANIDLAPGETRTDTFTYTVTDGWGSSDTATVTVTVTGAPDGSMAAPMAAFVVDGEADALAGFASFDFAQAETLVSADVQFA